MAKEWYFYDAGGVRRKVKEPYFYDAGGARRKVKEAYFYDAGGARRQFFSGVQPDVLAWTLNAGQSGNNSGFIRATIGSVVPVPFLSQNELMFQSYDNAAAVRKLTFRYDVAGTPLNRASFNVLIMTVAGVPKYFYTSAARIAAQNSWEWFYDEVPLAGAIPCALALGAPTQNSMTAGDGFGIAIGYSDSTYGSMQFGNRSSQINGAVITFFSDSVVSDLFTLDLFDPSGTITQGYFTSLTVNSKTYLTANATFSGTSTKRWSWTGRAGFVIGNSYGFSWA